MVENSIEGKPFTENDIGSKDRDVLITGDGSIVAYIDGACSDNGKEKSSGGIGVFWENDNQDNVSQPLIGRQTNNRAEIQAAITAIRKAKQNGHKRIIVRTSTRYLIDSVTKWKNEWEKNDWKLSNGEEVTNKEDFKELINEMSEMERVTWEKVQTGIPGHDKAAELARNGVKKET